MAVRVIIVNVEDMQPKLEWMEMDSIKPQLHQIWLPRPSIPGKASNQIRYVGHRYMFKNKEYMVYIWGLLRHDSGEIRSKLIEFLDSEVE